MLLAGTACGGEARLGADEEGYSHTSEEVPPPGIAEGRPVITIPQRGTHYACPPLRHGEPTPLLTDLCLAPGDAATSRFDDYSQLEPSIRCADGRSVTDAGLLGVGFVGEPLLPPDSVAPERGAIYDCLRAAGRG